MRKMSKEVLMPAVMTGDRVLSKEDYAAKKSAEMADMQKYVDAIQSSSDPIVMYRKGRAVTDIKEMLESGAEIYGDKVLYHQIMPGENEFTEISYKEALSDVNALGTAMLARGMQGWHVGIIGINCYEWSESYYTVLGGIGVAVPLDKELNADELSQLVNEGEVKAVICTSKYYETFKEMKAGGKTGLQYVIEITPARRDQDEEFSHEDEANGLLSWNALRAEGRKLLENGDTSYLDAQIDYKGLAAIVFTSGTTGNAKGVMLSNRNLCADVMVAQTYLEVRPEDIFFSVLPIHHTYECTCSMLEGMYCGASLAFCRGLKYIQKDMQIVKPSFLLAVPLIFEKFYNGIIKTIRKEGKEKAFNTLFKINNFTSKIGIDITKNTVATIMGNFGGNIRMFIAGGAKVDPEVLEFFKKMGIKTLQGYGLTETAPMVALNPDQWKYMNSNSAGRVLQATECKIDGKDEDGIGEICFRGPQVMLGYYKNPEATAEVIDEEGWFHTGDLGYLDDKNYVFITGRRKNVIITANGKNVFPEELEEYLIRSNFVEECMVWGDEANEDPLKRGIYATIKPDVENVTNALGEGYTAEQVEELLWKEVDKINETMPLFKKITHIVVRNRDFNKTTGMKIRRFIEDNKLGD